MFTAVEWMMAMRYLRARRQEGFISVIAWFSLLGIALGVATLIIVMAVMNGFRQELLSRILGLNGHLSIYGPPAGLTEFDRLVGTLEVRYDRSNGDQGGFYEGPNDVLVPDQSLVLAGLLWSLDR